MARGVRAPSIGEAWRVSKLLAADPGGAGRRIADFVRAREGGNI